MATEPEIRFVFRNPVLEQKVRSVIAFMRTTREGQILLRRTSELRGGVLVVTDIDVAGQAHGGVQPYSYFADPRIYRVEYPTIRISENDAQTIIKSSNRRVSVDEIVWH